MFEKIARHTESLHLKDKEFNVYFKLFLNKCALNFQELSTNKLRRTNLMSGNMFAETTAINQKEELMQGSGRFGKCPIELSIGIPYYLFPIP